MKDRQFVKGDYVVYGTNGICMIEDVKPLSFASGVEKSTYFILKPASNPVSTIFVPMKNEKLRSKMRDLMTKDEIDALLLGMKDTEYDWESDRRIRAENFHDILAEGVDQKLLIMIRGIYIKKRSLMEEGKKLPATDSNTLKAAEKLVEEEFAYALDIPQSDVGKYIRDLLGIHEDDED